MKAKLPNLGSIIHPAVNIRAEGNGFAAYFKNQRLGWHRKQKAALNHAKTVCKRAGVA